MRRALDRRRGAVRRGRRPEMGQTAVRAEARARPACACARTWTCLPICGRRSCSRRSIDASTLKPERDRRARYHDRARADRRRLFRRAARHRRPCPTAAAAASTPKSIRPPRSSASRASRSSWRGSAAAASASVEKANVMESGELWREEVQKAPRRGIRRRRALASCMPTIAPCSSCAIPSSST